MYRGVKLSLATISRLGHRSGGCLVGGTTTHFGPVFVRLESFPKCAVCLIRLRDRLGNDGNLSFENKETAIFLLCSSRVCLVDSLIVVKSSGMWVIRSEDVFERKSLICMLFCFIDGFIVVFEIKNRPNHLI